MNMKSMSLKKTPRPLCVRHDSGLYGTVRNAKKTVTCGVRTILVFEFAAIFGAGTVKYRVFYVRACVGACVCVTNNRSFIYIILFS
jgi:hypothetical protein